MNKQKLIKKWESAIEATEFYGKGEEDTLIEYMRDFVDDLNQLDEPEVLSQEWELSVLTNLNNSLDQVENEINRTKELARTYNSFVKRNDIKLKQLRTYQLELQHTIQKINPPN